MFSEMGLFSDGIDGTLILDACGSNKKNSSKVLLVQGLVSGSSVQMLAQQWHCPWLTCPLAQFPCGEWTVRALSGIEGKTIVVVHDLGPWQKDALMALGILTTALMKAKAATIWVIAPYLPYGRQNSPQNGPGFDILGQILGTFAIDHWMVMDAHSPKSMVQWPLSIQSISGIDIFLPELTGQEIDCVVSPDQGGYERAKNCAERLGCAWTTLSKTRTKKGIEMFHPNPEILRGQRCLIVDDILDTGHTLVKATEHLMESQAKSVMACVTHGLFSPGCLGLLECCGLTDLWISDSVPTFTMLPPRTNLPNIHTISWIYGLPDCSIISDYPIQ
jgi:ribose-phosphate pyrophosphokinase